MKQGVTQKSRKQGSRTFLSEAKPTRVPKGPEGVFVLVPKLRLGMQFVKLRFTTLRRIDWSFDMTAKGVTYRAGGLV